MKKKKIFLIGLNLYSIFLALKIRSKYKHSEITIVEKSNNFLLAFKGVKIKNYKLNSGFHALENLRSKEIIKFLDKKIKLKKISKTRGMLIGNKLISYIDTYNKWPKCILSKFKIKKTKEKIYTIKDTKSLDHNYLHYLANNLLGKKYNLKNTMSLTFPWFFPPNYDIKSKDEGVMFNSKIRNKSLKHSYFFPEKGHFNFISKALKKNLNNKNIKIKLNKPIEFSKRKNQIFFDGYEALNNPEFKKIICIPVKPLNDSIKVKVRLPKLKPIKYFTALIEIRNYIKSDLDKFCETIVSSEFALGLRRISLYSDIFNKRNKKIYQIEFTQHPEETNIDEQINKIIFLLSNFITFNNKKNTQNITLIGHTWLRNIFLPGKKSIEKISNYTNKFFQSKNDTIFPRQITWPINSNKHMLFAKMDFDQKINKFLND
jgi:hypothetical protein